MKCIRVGCGAEAEVLVGWVPAAAFRDSEELGRPTERCWARMCRVHGREIYLQARRNRQAPVYRIR